MILGRLLRKLQLAQQPALESLACSYRRRTGNCELTAVEELVLDEVQTRGATAVRDLPRARIVTHLILVSELLPAGGRRGFPNGPRLQHRLHTHIYELTEKGRFFAG
jgi:hypothetical protein